MTEAIYRTRGSLGSRLHQGDDGTWVACAQWPDRATWEAAGRLASADAEAGQWMRDSVLERLPDWTMTVVDDLLQSTVFDNRQEHP